MQLKNNPKSLISLTEFIYILCTNKDNKIEVMRNIKIFQKLKIPNYIIKIFFENSVKENYEVKKQDSS